ncbi:hypothetical protein WME99_06100 [Sorangium sp. So ce136]|uniref:hypothetical protein n=1 Tax=Sorangium sp. So ce136 TaxID=3133284 RepID=UPI003F051BBE
MVYDPMGQPTRILLDDSEAVEIGWDGRGMEARRALPGGGLIQSACDTIGRIFPRRSSGATSQAASLSGAGMWIIYTMPTHGSSRRGAPQSPGAPCAATAGTRGVSSKRPSSTTAR